MDKEQDYFSNLTDIYSFPFSLYHQPILSSIVEYVKKYAENQKDMKILDVGCGAGLKHTSLMNYATVFGIDVARKQIKYCQSRFGNNYIFVERGGKYPFPENYFDVIIVSEVLEHISKGDVPSFLAEIKRVLKNEGVIMVSTPNYASPILVILESTILELIARQRGFTRKGLHPNKYKADTLSADIRSNGFSVTTLKRISLGMALFCIASKL